MQCTYKIVASVTKLLDRSIVELKWMMIFLVHSDYIFCLDKYGWKIHAQAWQSAGYSCAIWKKKNLAFFSFVHLADIAALILILMEKKFNALVLMSNCHIPCFREMIDWYNDRLARMTLLCNGNYIEFKKIVRYFLHTLMVVMRQYATLRSATLDTKNIKRSFV